MTCSIEASNGDEISVTSEFRHQVQDRPIDQLRVNPRHARTHSKQKIGQLAAAIDAFKVINPIFVDGEGMVLAGHARLAAAKVLGLRTVPVMPLTHLTDEQQRAYVIADNRLAELAGWDPGLLASELKALLDVDFDVSLTGFDLDEIEMRIDAMDGIASEDDIPEPAGPAVSRIGDLWELGPHRLLCGSALDRSAYATLMGAERADMVFTDPPYNVPIQGHVSGLGRHRHREFAMGSGEMSAEAFTAFLRDAFKGMAEVSVDGSIHFVCMDWRHIAETLDAAKGVFNEYKNLVVWNKDNGGMGSLYRSKHELIFVFKNGTAPHVNMVQLGKHGRNRSNVWDFPGQNTFHRDRDKDLADHPTVKPVALVADAIRDVSRRNAIVLDPFGGSGTTLIAAEKASRRARLIELDPAYVDVTIRRWQTLTGGQARHVETGSTFLTLTESRTGDRSDAA